MSDPTTQLDASTIAALASRGREDLYFFAKGILGFDWLVPHIHKPICKLLEDEKNTRLKGVLPRGWLKSTLFSVAYPIWRGVKNPNIRVAIVQNSHTNACKKLAVIRGKFESCALLRTLYPEVLPDKNCVWTADSACLKRSAQHAEATFEAAGTRTKMTSRHYNVIIEDDTVAPDLDDMSGEMLLPSKEDVEQAIGWHRNVLPLLVNPSTDQVLIVGTRWFEKDLISWNEDHEKHYKSYYRACRETNGVADPLGEVTYPERFSAGVLQELETAMGPYLFNCLYMNLPMSGGDMAFQSEWFQYYETQPRDLMCYTTIDSAGDPGESKGETDFNVVMTCGKDISTGRVYALDYFRAKCGPSEVINALFEQVRKYRPVKVGIETIQEKFLIYWIRERMRSDNTYFLVEAITHHRNKKHVRVMGLQPLVKAGMLMFRTWMRLLVTELMTCSVSRGMLGVNDDLADALSMQLPMWAMTVSRRELAANDPSDDPFSFDNAERQLASASDRREKLGSHAYSFLSSN